MLETCLDLLEIIVTVLHNTSKEMLLSSANAAGQHQLQPGRSARAKKKSKVCLVPEKFTNYSFFALKNILIRSVFL